MAKKKLKKDVPSFEYLEQGLKQDFEKYQIASSKQKQHLLYLALALGLFLIFITALYLNNLSKAQVELAQSEASSQVIEASMTDDLSVSTSSEAASQSAFLRDLIAPEEAFNFKWTLDNFEALVTGQKIDATGDSLESILAEFGQPSEARFGLSEDYLFIVYSHTVYDIYADSKRVELSFYRDGEAYYLSGKTGYRLESEAYPVIGESETTFQWTDENFAALQVGDGDTGLGGAVYTDVVGQFGLPQTSYFIITQFSRSLHVQYTYQTVYGRKTVDLVFKGQPDGSYQLAQKNGDL